MAATYTYQGEFGCEERLPLTNDEWIASWWVKKVQVAKSNYAYFITTIYQETNRKQIPAR